MKKTNNKGFSLVDYGSINGCNWTTAVKKC